MVQKLYLAIDLINLRVDNGMPLFLVLYRSFDVHHLLVDFMPPLVQSIYSRMIRFFLLLIESILLIQLLRELLELLNLFILFFRIWILHLGHFVLNLDSSLLKSITVVCQALNNLLVFPNRCLLGQDLLSFIGDCLFVDHELVIHDIIFLDFLFDLLFPLHHSLLFFAN